MNTDSQIIAKFIGETKREMADIAESAMLRPKSELFALGESAGRYQGLQKSLDILEDILSDKLKEERLS